jgi:hypothetical protein
VLQKHSPVMFGKDPPSRSNPPLGGPRRSFRLGRRVLGRGPAARVSTTRVTRLALTGRARLVSTPVQLPPTAALMTADQTSWSPPITSGLCRLRLQPNNLRRSQGASASATATTTHRGAVVPNRAQQSADTWSAGRRYANATLGRRKQPAARRPPLSAFRPTHTPPAMGRCVPGAPSSSVSPLVRHTPPPSSSSDPSHEAIRLTDMPQ